jgi:DNA-binding MarR family transcriptional regulator
MALRRQVCFALYAASRATTALYRPLLDELGLTYPQYLVLLVLWERDGRTVKELGEELRLDSGTLSPLLKRMEAAGLVERHRTAGDERVVEVRLTAAGTELQLRARSVPAALVAATGLDRKTLVELRDTLTTFASTMDTAAQELAAEKK